MIPPLIHQWWSGSPLPDRFADLSAQLQAMNPGWTVHRWEPETIGPLAAQRHYDEAARYVATHRVEVYRSNLVRYELLSTFGGIYIDYDFQPLRPFGQLPEVDCFVGANPANPDPAVLGAVPGHPFPAMLTAEARHAGPTVVRTCPGCEHVNEVLPVPGVTVLPAWMFYPRGDDERSIAYAQPAYT